ncbi:MAG: bifunctional demethylmenaquinone methyltransferase/2-methoxy-6-polyprenyl-1,4-benzoquinol methylase UbiE [Pseudomonadota bacterium]|nr:bifunctional demethylmenaquinone methyltransferase/2-methoxy-6-polyprenyl-1,4-benzoquinol methylase UbiE [Pseudomonadota bacterium]
MPGSTHFGFRKVPAEEKTTLVRGVFDRVASRYDLMNDLMSGGLHRLWKNDMVAWLSPKDGMHILDVAGGTGDIAFRMLARAECHVTVCDINRHMLEEGHNRAIDRNLPEGIDWLCANAESLPLPDRSFDAYTIAFGIRNVTHIDAALREAYRVLKPGGRFLCLEFSHVAHDWLQKIYDRYSFRVIPKLGEWITGSGEPYQYLVESIRQFPAQEEFAAMIRAAGFGNVQYRNLTQGVVAMHSGRRL